MIVGKRIKELRKRLSLTQEELAERVGVSRSALANYESGLREPKGDILVRFAKVFNITTDYLLGKAGRTNNPKPTDNNHSDPTPEQRIAEALADNLELLEFFQELTKRDDLQLLFKQTKSLSPDSIKRIIRYIKMVEDEEAAR